MKFRVPVVWRPHLTSLTRTSPPCFFGAHACSCSQQASLTSPRTWEEGLVCSLRCWFSGAQRRAWHVVGANCDFPNEIMLLCQIFEVFISSAQIFFPPQSILETTSEAVLSVVNGRTQAALDRGNHAHRYVNKPRLRPCCFGRAHGLAKTPTQARVS